MTPPLEGTDVAAVEAALESFERQAGPRDGSAHLGTAIVAARCTVDAWRRPRRHGRAALFFVIEALATFDLPRFVGAFVPWVLDPVNALDAGASPELLGVVSVGGPHGVPPELMSYFAFRPLTRVAIPRTFLHSGGTFQVEVRGASGLRRLEASLQPLHDAPDRALVLLPAGDLTPGAEVWEVGV